MPALRAWIRFNFGIRDRACIDAGQYPAVRHESRAGVIARPGDNRADVVAAPLIDAAIRAGITVIVSVTAFGVEHDEAFMLRKLERYIEESGIAYTHLRPNWFMQVFSSGPMLADIRNTAALHLPAEDARISFVDVRDIAAVAFQALTQSSHAGKAYTLTGKEALNHFDVAEKISTAAPSPTTRNQAFPRFHPSWRFSSLPPFPKIRVHPYSIVFPGHYNSRTLAIIPVLSRKILEGTELMELRGNRDISHRRHAAACFAVLSALIIGARDNTLREIREPFPAASGARSAQWRKDSKPDESWPELIPQIGDGKRMVLKIQANHLRHGRIRSPIPVAA